MQNPETQRNVEALAELVDVKRVHSSILHPRRGQSGDRAEAAAAPERHAEPRAPTRLLVIDREHAPRAAELR
jgi:hypothetical protein